MFATEQVLWRGGGWGREGVVGAGWDWAYGMGPKKAYVSKTTEPNLKNEYAWNQHEQGLRSRVRKS